MVAAKFAERGSDVSGAFIYLYGPGRANEHHDPHLVAGWRHPADLEPHLSTDGDRDLARLTALLEAPVMASCMGEGERAASVWHCVIRAAPEDPVLDDDGWAHIAHEVMDRLGLSPRGQSDTGVRWVAVQHSRPEDQHIHIVATLARQDLRRPNLNNDRYLLQAACRDLEHDLGLRVIDARDRTAACRPTRQEIEQARRFGWREPARTALRRTMITTGAATTTPEELLAGLDAAGVDVRLHHSATDPERVDGYCVASRRHRRADGSVQWFRGGSLAADLTWPKLTARWTDTDPASPPGAEDSRSAGVWELASTAITAAGTDLQRAQTGEDGGSADTAWALSDLLHVIATRIHGGVDVLVAADLYERAGRPPWGRIPRSSPAGRRLRAVARALATANEPFDPQLVQRVLAETADVVEVVAGLRQAQDRTVPAAAARAAAARLRAAQSSTGIHGPEQRLRPGGGSAALISGTDFPDAPSIQSGSSPSTPLTGTPPGARRPKDPPRRRGPGQ